MKIHFRKPIAWLLTLAMLFTMIPGAAFAAEADNLCEHHAEHTAECGYVEGVSDCAYHCDVCLGHDHGDEVTEEDTESAPVCDCGTDDPAIHATTCAVYVAPENPVCYCAEKCTEVNEWCDVCGFDYTACTGTDTATDYGANSVSYVDYTWNEESKTLSSETKSVDTYTEITSTTTEMTSGWYVVNGEVTVAERMTATGEVHLILADGAHLTASLGITVNEGNSLYIYGQSSDESTMGKLTATTTGSDAAIGGLKFNHAGTIVINGGNINASTSGKGAGIGSGEYCGGYQITINAGVVTATSSRSSAAIGSGNNGGDGAVWGTVHSICINGGVVNATQTANGGAAIGGGNLFDGGDITITGGTVTATNKGAAAAIGGGMYGSGGNITITGGNVTATYTHSFRYGAAIGAGYSGESAGNILITGGTVTATSTYGCGIGVFSGDNGRIVILGGTVSASGSGTVHINAGASGSMMLVDGTTVTISGDFTLQTDFVLPEGYTLKISEGATLTIPEGVTLTLPEEYTLISNGTVNAVGTVSCIAHKYVEGVCICGLECSHVGGTPTCTATAVCTTCGTAYGEVDPTNHNWENGVCTYGCNTIHEPHDWSGKDGICTICGEPCPGHTGGEATCTEKAVCTICGASYGELGGHTAEPTYAPNAEDSTKHDVTYSCCGTTVTEDHTLDVTTGKCSACGADMTVVATVTDGTNTYYAADADTLNQAVTAILGTGSRTFTVELPADAEAGMITAIRRAICDAEGVADGSIHLTLKGVTTIPGTTNWDGVAFGPRNAQWDENNVEIVSHEEVTQLASINLPDVTEIGAQAFLDCSNLTSITAPKVQSIGDWGLQSTAITSIDMPLLKEAGYSAFCRTALTEVSLPSLETAGVIVFGHCEQLRTVDLPKLQNLSQQLFTRCTSLVSVSAPAATSMGINVFKGCSELVSITLPGVTELTYEAFAECTKLENITLGSVITSVNVNLFAGEALSSGITLTLNCGQENAETLPAAAGTNVEWAGFTWKKVKFAHSYVNSKCTACGEDCTHTGGTATCTTLAVCDTCGVSYGAVDTTNHDSSVECVNGFCPNGCYEPATLNAEGYYEIDNAGKLFWFAQQVNVKGNREIKGVLTADIDLENKPWTPIGETGEENNNFRGVFDGQNHTIRGLYVEGSENGVGFFGEVRTGTVKNFRIYGNVVVNTEVNYVGGVIGSICGVNGETSIEERNGAVIQNITSFVNVTAKAHGIGMIGGFVGYANHQSLIEKCAWYGTFDAGEYRVDSGAGGFIGKIQENTSEVTIRNCGAYGTIKTNYAGDYNNTATIYMGGFLSFSNTGAKTTIEDCLFAGRFERGANLTDEARLGAFGTLRSVNAIKNCYYLGDDGLAAVHSDSDLKPGSDNVDITSVTGEDLRGEMLAVWARLGEYWMQDVHYPIPKDTKAHSDSVTYTYTDNGDGTHKKTCNECGYVEEVKEEHYVDPTTTYTDNGDGTHSFKCAKCNAVMDSEPHTIENHVCTGCGAMEIVVSFNAGDYEWETGNQIRLARWTGDFLDDYYFTAEVAEDGTVTWTPDKTLCWNGTDKHTLAVSYPNMDLLYQNFGIPEDQSTLEKLREADCMNAIWSGNPTTDPITFDLKHRLAKVTVNYEIAEGVTVSKAEVYTLTKYMFFDIRTLERVDVAWEEGDDRWINSYLGGNQFTAFVSPDAYAADGNFIKITLSDGSVREVKMNKAVTFEEGAEYTYKVVITADGAYLTCADECTFEYTDNEDGLTHSKVCTECGYVAASENHTLTYISDEDANTITESCSANCGYSASLTLKAPANLVYDRTEKAATVEGEIIADYELTYSADAVIMAGDYTATLTVGDYSVSLAFTIAKADPDVATPTGLTATYGQTLADVELPGGWAWKNSSASVGSVGSNTFAAIYTPANISNFNTLERDLTVVVAKAMPTVTAPVAADDLVYNGTEQALITAGTATGGTMQYSLDGSNWSETIPTGKDAKTYTVYYKVVGDSNHNDSSVDSVQATIGKATLTVTADNKTMTTGQNLPTFTYTITGFVGGETEEVLTTKPTASCEANGQTAGTYDITVSGAAADNYEITHVNGTLSVADHQHAWTYTAKDDTITATCNAEGCPDAEQSITISAVGKIYDGTPVTATLNGSIDGVATPEITYTGNASAGTHTASITIEGETASVKFTIEKATVTVTADAKSKPYGTDNPTLTYTSEGLFGDDVLTGALETTATKTSNVGEYDITVGSLAGSNYTIDFVGAKLTITKAAAPEIQWPTAAALTYGQKLSDSALTSEDKNGTFAWQDGSIVPTVTNDGYVVVYTPKDTDNYDYSSVKLTETISVTVSKVSATVTAAPTPNTLTYTGEAQYLINAGEANGGTMQYSTDNQTWSTTISQGTDAGKYTVYYKVVGDENHSDTAVDSIEVTIAKADPVIGTVGCEMALFDSTDISTVELTRTDMSVDGTLILTDSELTAGEGTYNWKFTPEDTDNYNTITGTVVLTVTADVLEQIRATGTLEKFSYVYGELFSIDGMTVTASYTSGTTKDVTGLVSFDSTLAVGQTAVELTYQGKICVIDGITVARKQLDVSGMIWTVPTNAVYSGTAYTATLNGTLPEGVSVTKTGDKATNAGEYTAKAVFSLADGYSADNYEIVNGEDLTEAWSIAKKDIAGADVVLGDTLTYTGSEQTQTVTKVEIDGLTVTYTVSGNTGTDVGKYTLTVTGTGNYNGSVTKEWSIGKAAAVIATAPTENDLIYTGTAQNLVNAGSANGGTIVYSLSENGQYTETIPTGTNAGEHTVWYYVVGDANHSDSAKTSVTSVISKAELTITAKNHTITYGDAPVANGVVYSGFVNTESEAVLAGTLIYGFNYEQYGDVGTYKITPSGVTSGNYEIAFVSGDLSVTAKGLSVKAEAKTKIYGETDPELTYQVDGLVGGDALTGTLERTSGENVGAYAIKQGTLTAGGNYTITYTGAVLTINPKAITEADVELKGTLTYNGSEQIQQITGKNGITCDVTGNKANDVGTYELTVTGTGNYTGEVKLSYTVAKKPISVVWENTNLVYNGSAQSPVAKLAGVVTDDDVQAVVNGNGTNAGTYDATVSLTGTDADNYALTGSTKFTIARAPVTFKVSNNSVEEGKTIAVTVISEPAGVGHTVTYRQNGDVVTPSAVGEYDIYVEITDSNYRHAASANGNAIKIGVLTIYEGKKPATYTLSYAPGEGSGTMAAEEAALAGTIRILPECTFTAPKDNNNNDMLFVGWTDGNATYKAGEQYRQPEKNVTMTALWVVEEHNISGMVKQFVSLDSADLVNRGGVVVTLMLGSKQVAQAVADANGNYKFEHCLLGTYNLVAEYEGIRQTAKAVLGHSDMSDLEIDLPAGKTNSTVDVEPGTPDVVVGGLDEMMKTTDDKVFTEEDKEVVEQGGEVEIKMEVKENPAPEKKDDLEKKAEEISTVTEIGIFIDLDLTKTVTEAAETTGTTTTIAEASKLLENIIFLPGHLQGKNAYHVFRDHGGQIEEMTELRSVPTGNNEGFIVDRVNHTITIYSMKYSTYAIAYTDPFTITFNANGGKVDVESAITGTDGTLESLPTPTRSGYTFKGWFTAESGGTEVTTDTVFNADKIIYAQWTMNYVPTPSGGSTNKITVSTALNGKVSADLSNAKEGTTVTITVEPDDGYELDELLVSDASGNELKVTANGNNKYSFVMPDSKVSIKATFVPEREECTGGDSCLSAQFSDLDPSLWYHEATDYVLENGLMNGVGGGKFDPNGTTSRAMIVTILWRLEGEPVVNYLMQFEDVAAESWYTEAVRWAASEGIVTGYSDVAFGPNDPITREQLATILYRYEQYEGGGFTGAWMFLLDYSDRDKVSDWAYEAMCWTTMHGVINGKGDGILDPKGNAKRCEAAQMLMNYLSK